MSLNERFYTGDDLVSSLSSTLISGAGGSAVLFGFHPGCYEHSAIWWRWTTLPSVFINVYNVIYSEYITYSVLQPYNKSFYIIFPLSICSQYIYSIIWQSGNRILENFASNFSLFSWTPLAAITAVSLVGYDTTSWAHLDFLFSKVLFLVVSVRNKALLLETSCRQRATRQTYTPAAAVRTKSDRAVYHFLPFFSADPLKLRQDAYNWGQIVQSWSTLGSIRCFLCKPSLRRGVRLMSRSVECYSDGCPLPIATLWPSF